MLRKLGIWLTVLVLAAAAADTAVWYWAVQQMRGAVTAWVAARRASGWTVTAEAPEAGGWPVAATLTLRNVALQGGTAVLPGGIAWGAEQLELRLAARHPRELRIDAAGAQHLRVSAGPDLAITAERLGLVVKLPAAPSALPLELQGEALRISEASSRQGPLTIGHLSVHALLHPDAERGQPAATLSGGAADIGLPSDRRSALGEQIRSVSVDATLNGPLPAASGPRATATAWRNAGGSLELARLATQWGPLGLTASGTLHLDAQLQPAGSLDANITGYAATLDALARHGVMARSAAMTATALLSLIAETPAGGGPPAVDVPLSLHDGMLFLQRIPLLTVPALDWPSQ